MPRTIILDDQTAAALLLALQNSTDASAQPAAAAGNAGAGAFSPKAAVGSTSGSTETRIDEPVPVGTPGTVTLPVTGHTLSLPVLNAGEGLLGYFVRTSKQTGGDPNAAGGLVTMQSGSPSQTGNSMTDWPITCDWYANLHVYNIGSDAIIDKANADRGNVRVNGPIPASSITPEDARAIYWLNHQFYHGQRIMDAQFKLLNGSAADVQRAYGQAYAKYGEGMLVNYDPASYTGKVAVEAAKIWP